MRNNLLQYLNPAQQKAVLATEGPVLILAGAGSGKTRVLTYKTAYLIQEKKVPPENIILVTFTNKAANEMKERISKLLTNYLKRQLPYAGTFHSLCAKIIRREGKNIGIPLDFTIYDEQDVRAAIKEIIDNLGLDLKKFSPGAVAGTISQAKNELLSANEYPNWARGYFQEGVAKVYLAYQKVLFKNNALDFDDLIFCCVNLLRNIKNVATYYQDRFRYVLVDEYQDTNHAQYELTKLLSKKWHNLSVVGDASQSIYSFRGADFTNILNFQKNYPKVKIFHLEQNYRSTNTILQASYSIISQNRSHPILKLWTEKNEGEPISIFQANDENAEVTYIVNEIQNLRCRNPSLKLNDMAILYRTNAQSRILEEILLREGISYTLIGGIRFYERKEIKDLLSYLRLLANPKDQVSLKRVEKIGKRRYAKFLQFSQNYLQNHKKQPYSTFELLDKIIEATAYLEFFDPHNPEELAKLENIKELHSVASQYPDLINFLENVALMEEEHLSKTKNNVLMEVSDHNYHEKISLMTMHAAKGLEFRVVFIVGMEEGLFPHIRSILEPFELEEERRLCYVGMTRAKEKLYLTFANQRLFFGQRNANQVSRFITDLPSHLVQFTTHDSI